MRYMSSVHNLTTNISHLVDDFHASALKAASQPFPPPLPPREGQGEGTQLADTIISLAVEPPGMTIPARMALTEENLVSFPHVLGGNPGV
jgi:hypothetical protein